MRSTSWRQEGIEAHAREISELGRELYDRLAAMGGHFADLGRSLGRAVDCYNRAVGSMESRVLVSARRFRDLEAAGPTGEIETAAPIETRPRGVQAPELAEPDEAEQPAGSGG